MNNRLGELRKEKELTQKDIAKLLNVNHAVISRIESGDRPLKGEEALTLSKYFNVSTDYLLGASNIKNPNIQGKENPRITILARNASSLTENQIKLVESLIDQFKKENNID